MVDVCGATTCGAIETTGLYANSNTVREENKNKNQPVILSFAHNQRLHGHFYNKHICGQERSVPSHVHGGGELG